MFMLPPIYDADLVGQKQPTRSNSSTQKPEDLKEVFARGATRLPAAGIDVLVFWDTSSSPITKKYNCLPSSKFLVDHGDMTEDEMKALSGDLENGVYLIPFAGNVFGYDLESKIGQMCSYITTPIDSDMIANKVSLIFSGSTLNNVPWSYVKGQKFAQHCQTFIDSLNSAYSENSYDAFQKMLESIPRVVVHAYSLPIKNS